MSSTESPTLSRLDKLVRTYDQWLAMQPDHIANAHDTSAEALLHEDITAEQRRWLSEFILKWNECCDA